MNKFISVNCWRNNKILFLIGFYGDVLRKKRMIQLDINNNNQLNITTRILSSNYSTMNILLNTQK